MMPRYTGPTAELHVHLEGTITPTTCNYLARCNNIDLPLDLFRPSEDGLVYNWRDFRDLVIRVYDIVAGTVRTEDDYHWITYKYLQSLARDCNCVYSEIIVSPDHARLVGIPYARMIDAVVDGITEAEENFGIVCRLNSTLVRHGPLGDINRSVQDIIDYPHPYVRGFDLAGVEGYHDVHKLRAFLETLKEAGFRPRVHAGEVPGNTSNMLAAIDLGCTRIGHGVQAASSGLLLDQLKKNKVMLEISLWSNHYSESYNLMSHPIREFLEMEIPISLNSDDPGLFGTKVLNEYNTAMERFGFTEEDLQRVTRDAIHYSFLEEEEKFKLLEKIK